jgi:hypothetical protein
LGYIRFLPLVDVTSGFDFSDEKMFRKIDVQEDKYPDYELHYRQALLFCFGSMHTSSLIKSNTWIDEFFANQFVLVSTVLKQNMPNKKAANTS